MVECSFIVELTKDMTQRSADLLFCILHAIDHFAYRGQLSAHATSRWVRLHDRQLMWYTHSP